MAGGGGAKWCQAEITDCAHAPATASQLDDGSLGSLIHVACHVLPSWAGGRHGIAFIVTVAMEIFWKPRIGKSLHDFVLQTARRSTNKYIY